MIERREMDLYGKLKAFRMMLIDDDEWIRNSLRFFFESEGCRLLALETAEEGLEALEKENYDIIIVDYKLPGMDGLRFLEAIQISHPAAIKLLITAYGNEDVISGSRRVGVHEFIQKPFTSKTLEKSLSRLIEERERASRNLEGKQGSSK
jgi:two-component system response regulator HydG